jgi:hypothetical protein
MAKFAEGDWFVVPLDNGRQACGLVARKGRKATVFGYFFDVPKSSMDPQHLSHLQPSDAVLGGKFSYLGLRGGTWRVIGHHTNWQRDIWAMPGFQRDEELTGRTFLVTYDESDDLHVVVREVRVAPADVPPGTLSDGLMGARFVEIRLSRLLS